MQTPEGAQYLISERNKILEELKAIEGLLVSRYGWKPQAATALEEKKVSSSISTVVSPQRFYGGGDIANLPIPYTTDFKEWLKTQPTEFTVGQFREYLIEKYGSDKVNENSLRTPFTLMEKSGEIQIVERGSGRRPTTYVRKDGFVV